METSLRDHLMYAKYPTAFMENKWFGYDVFEKKTLTKLKPFEYQKKFLEFIHENKACIIAQSRQMHVSSMVALYLAWYAIFNDEKTILIISSSMASSKKILNSICFIIENYLLDKQGGFISAERSTEITLINGTRIIAKSDSVDAPRGFRSDIIYIDNAAYMKNLEDIFYAASPTLWAGKDAKFIISSAPKNNSYFNKMFLETNETSEFKPLRLTWQEHPVYSKDMQKEGDTDEYTSPWYEDMCKIIYNKESIEQELDCVIRYNEKTNKSKLISLRLEQDVYNKIVEKITKDKNVSDYIRDLINKDLEL